MADDTATPDDLSDDPTVLREMVRELLDRLKDCGPYNRANKSAEPEPNLTVPKMA